MILDELRQEVRRLLSLPPNRTIVAGPLGMGKRKAIRNVLDENVSSSDFIEVDGSIDGARNAQSFLKNFPIDGNVRAVFVDGNKFSDAAQDAYLKLCEDDLEFSSIIFVVEDDGLLRSALRSRVDVVRVSGEFDPESFSSSVAKGRAELLETISANQKSLQGFHATLCDTIDGKRDFSSIPELIMKWSDADDDIKNAILATCEFAIRSKPGGDLTGVAKFVDTMRSTPSANAEIYWWRLCVM